MSLIWNSVAALAVGTAVGALNMGGKSRTAGVLASGLLGGGMITAIVTPGDASSALLSGGASGGVIHVLQTLQMLAGEGSLGRHLAQNPCSTGSIAASSGRLAKALVKRLEDAPRSPNKPIRVLEVGPGTGAITGAILGALRPGDRLDLLEINPDLVRQLQSQVPGMAAGRPGVKVSIIEGSVSKYSAEPYDFIISTVPHSNFPSGLLVMTLEAYMRLLKSKGNLSYIEYVFGREFRSAIASSDERRRIEQVDSQMAELVDRYGCGSETVLLNLPPASVKHICKP